MAPGVSLRVKRVPDNPGQFFLSTYFLNFAFINSGAWPGLGSWSRAGMVRRIVHVHLPYLTNYARRETVSSRSNAINFGRPTDSTTWDRN